MPSNPPEGSHGILTAGFRADESTPYVRRILLDEAAGKNEGATRFEFNMYAVVLDFDAGTATVEDLSRRAVRRRSDSKALCQLLRRTAMTGPSATGSRRRSGTLLRFGRMPPELWSRLSGHRRAVAKCRSRGRRAAVPTARRRGVTRTEGSFALASDADDPAVGAGQTVDGTLSIIRLHGRGAGLRNSV